MTHYQVRTFTPEYAGLRQQALRTGWHHIVSQFANPREDRSSRFSLVDEDGTPLLDFRLEN
jgi:hypothetical protein